MSNINIELELLRIDEELLTKENKLNKRSNLINPNNTTYPTTKAVKDALDLKVDIDTLDSKEDKSNKVENLDNPNNYQYPTTKAVTKELTKKASATTLSNHLSAINPHGLTAALLDAYTKGEITQLLNNLPSSIELTNHKLDKVNPHEVTANQVGAYTITQIDDSINDILRLINLSKGEAVGDSKEYTDSFVYTDKETGEEGPTNYLIWLDTYKENKGNKVPHLNSPSHTSFPTTLAVKTELDKKLDESIYDNHRLNYYNPHRTTAEQVGAYSKVYIDGELDKKVNKTLSIAGKPLSNSITALSLTDALPTATEIRKGLMSASDKIKLEALADLLENVEDREEFIRLLNEVINIIEENSDELDILNILADKVDKETGKELSDNNYTDIDKIKVDGFDLDTYNEIIDMLTWTDEE